MKKIVSNVARDKIVFFLWKIKLLFFFYYLNIHVTRTASFEKEACMDTAGETPHFVLKVWHHVSLMFNFKEYFIRVSQCYELTALVVISSFLFFCYLEGNRNGFWVLYRTPKMLHWECLARHFHIIILLPYIWV